jgi:hypothetical protein
VDRQCECVFDIWILILCELWDNVNGNIVYVMMNLIHVLIICFLCCHMWRETK